MFFSLSLSSTLLQLGIVQDFQTQIAVCTIIYSSL
jgi:hypothetical protein